MIKFVMCVRRRSGLTRAQFHDYWLNRHGPLFARYAATYRAVRYVQSHTLTTPLNDAVRRARGMSAGGGAGALDADEAFDGIGEIWWESEQDFVAAVGSAEGQMLRRLFLKDEARFVDATRSTAFFTCEHVLVDTTPQASHPLS